MAPDEARRVGSHLLVCSRCRLEHDEIKAGLALLQTLDSQTAPPGMWNQIAVALSQPQRSARGLSSVFLAWPRMIAYAALAVAIGAAITLYLRRTPDAPRAAFEVVRIEGAPTIEKGRLSAQGRLHIGEWLETDARSRAQIKVAEIGHVEVAPSSRVGLVMTAPTEHRLKLARGKLEAEILAPPRLFIVETPSAVAIDLGCAYVLEVDEAGTGRLRVTSGYVALERDERESIVVAGAACETRPGIGPGTPYFEDASVELRSALERFDFAGGGIDALRPVIEGSRRRDTLTLWHLLSRVEEAHRGMIYDRLVTLVAPPDGVTRDAILRLDAPILKKYRETLEWVWFE
jgi:hypothetical protein